MLEDLFIADSYGNAIGSNVELSEYIENWPMEIQSALMERVPVLADIPGQLNFSAVDQDKKYAKGAYVIPVGEDPNDAVTIPILIKAGKLLPLDLYIYNDEWKVMDPSDIERILMSPSLGDELISASDVPPIVYNSLSGRITPPGGYGSGVVSSMATKMGALNRPLSEQLIKIVMKDPSTKALLGRNKIAANRFSAILDADATQVKKASGSDGMLAIEGDKVIYSIGNGMFSIKSASICDETGEVAVNTVECNGDQLASWMKFAEMDIPRILSELKSRKMAFTWKDEQEPEADSISIISSPGKYACYNRETCDPVNSELVGYVKTALDEKSYLTLNSDGTYSLQMKIAGKRAPEGGAVSEKTAALGVGADSIRVGDTITIPVGGGDDENDPLEMSPPTKVASVVNCSNGAESYCVVSGTSPRGKIAYVMTDDERVDIPIKTKYIPEGVFIDKLADVWYMPNSYPVMKLPAEKTALLQDMDDVHSSLFLKGKGSSPVVRCQMWDAGRSSTAIKVGARSPQIIDKTAAMLLIKQAEGTNVMSSMVKMAEGKIKVLDLIKGSGGKTMYLASKTKDLGVNKQDEDKKKLQKEACRKIDHATILKTAAAMSDEEDIDTVLALNYVTPENLMEFKEVLPSMKKVEESLAKMLMAIRLGANMGDESSVSTTLTSLHEIIKSIEMGM